MSGYAKVFRSLWEGTLRGHSDEILVFVNLLTNANAKGNVDRHFKPISDETGLSMERVRAAILQLEGVDSESRTKTEQGRRIVRLDDHRDWGWRIVNYTMYRALGADAEALREQSRLRMQKMRERRQTISEQGVTLRNKSYQICNHQDDNNKQDLLRNVTPSPVPVPVSYSSSSRKGGVGERDSLALFDHLKQHLYTMFSRSDHEPLSQVEQVTLAEVARRPNAMDELSALKSFKTHEKYFPQSILSLLEKWQSTLDRTRNNQQKPKSPFLP